MMIRVAKGFHALVAVVLVVCALCPLVEMALHLNGSIFKHGCDTGSTLALILLLLELSFALGRLTVALLALVLKQLSCGYFHLDRLTLPALNFAIVLPEISPPLFLRI